MIEKLDDFTETFLVQFASDMANAIIGSLYTSHLSDDELNRRWAWIRWSEYWRKRQEFA